MMSLLLCFFIMLFAMSTITPIKWEAFIEVQQMKMGFSGQSRTLSQNKLPFAATNSSPEMSRRTAALTGGQPEPGRAGDAKNRSTIRSDGDLVKGGLIRFELRSAVLTAQAKSDLEALLKPLSKSSSKIAVVGYVAPAEEEGGSFSRGIYLAQARAVNVTEHLVKLGLSKNFFVISISTSIPDRAILRPDESPQLAGASAAVYLIANTARPVGTP